MARPSKSVEVIENEKKSHRTKAEIEQRKKAEQAALTGIKMREEPETRTDEIAHQEFARVKKILNAVGKNDALYEAGINEYCLLKSDIARYKQRMKDIEEAKDMSSKDKYAIILDCENRIERAKKRRFDIEKENGMTIASSLRAIPKKVEKAENPLLEILSD